MECSHLGPRRIHTGAPRAPPRGRDGNVGQRSSLLSGHERLLAAQAARDEDKDARRAQVTKSDGLLRLVYDNRGGLGEAERDGLR